MNNKLLLVAGYLALIASVAMRLLSRNNANLTELSRFWWIPLPFALVCFLAASRKKAS